MSLFDTTWSLQVEKLLPPCLREADFADNGSGDFAIIDPQNDYIGFIIVSSPGHWKEFPLIGVGIINYIQGTQNGQVLQRNIREQLQSDVFQKPFIDVSKFPTIEINSVIFNVG